jgi:hypothetical protein
LLLEGLGWVFGVLIIYVLGVILPAVACVLVGLLQIGLMVVLYDGSRPLNRQSPALYGAAAATLLLLGVGVRSLF